MDIREDGYAGSFITFEGVEGAGKSSRCLTLVKSLEAAGFPVMHTREPGGPRASERIRDILLDPGLRVTPLTELMLYLASRASNTELLIRPALEEGVNVICERFSDATFAYQIGGRGLPEEPVRNADGLATGGLLPDLIVLLDLDPEVGLARLERQGRERDRIEQEEIMFHRRVREMYLRLAGENPRYLVVDAEQEPLVQDRIIELEVTAMLEKRGSGRGEKR
ncbi:MAG: hypothetical protein AVO35_00675 [Candidatus Aegiribacteria sp. MLS_C]|nr:MAG: hypothetical protein AVO35_00675 [Candidatus Aegiribacteria sp. MLS_C]